MKTLSIATDCSGIESPIQALTSLKVPFNHLWSSDNNKYVKKSIMLNYKPKYFFDDITTRKTLPKEKLDIYVCGFPCQSFSQMGEKAGMKDPRGNIMNQCIDVINKKSPKIFILENVKHFKFIDDGKPFEYLLKQLNKNKKYNIYHEILNTKHYGIPQNRERIFFIGIRKDIQTKEWSTPTHIKCRPVEDFIIDKKIYQEHESSQILLKHLAHINNQDNYFVSAVSFTSYMKGIFPTLTTGCGSIYMTTYNRFISHKEALLLQGFPKSFKIGVSDTQIYKQAGNSITVNVLKAIFKKIFSITKLT